MAWNQLATDLGCITPPHTVANIMGIKNCQVFLLHPVLCVPVIQTDSFLTVLTEWESFLAYT